MIVFTCVDEKYHQRADRMIRSVFAHNSDCVGFVVLINERDFQKDADRIDHVANLRAKVANDLLSQEHLPPDTLIVYLDADSICRGKIIVPNSDISTLSVPHAADDFNKFLISSMFFRNNARTKAFISAWLEVIRDIQNTGARSIMTCQLAFKLNMDFMGHAINFADCGEDLCDSDLRDDSIIWCGRGARKNAERYLAEEMKYA